MGTLTHHAALLDDVEMLDRAIGGLDDALAGRIETQLTLFNQVRQVSVFHLIERGKRWRNCRVPWMFCNTAVFPAWVKASALLITITAVFLKLLLSDDSAMVSF